MNGSVTSKRMQVARHVPSCLALIVTYPRRVDVTSGRAQSPAPYQNAPVLHEERRRVVVPRRREGLRELEPRPCCGVVHFDAQHGKVVRERPGVGLAAHHHDHPARERHYVERRPAPRHVGQPLHSRAIRVVGQGNVNDVGAGTRGLVGNVVVLHAPHREDLVNVKHDRPADHRVRVVPARAAPIGNKKKICKARRGQ